MFSDVYTLHVLYLAQVSKIPIVYASTWYSI